MLPEVQHSQALPSPLVKCVLPNIIKVGDCGKVCWFPGEVTTLMGKSIYVSVIIRTGNLWTWSSTPDKVFYELGDIVQVISPPEVAGSRCQFREI